MTALLLLTLVAQLAAIPGGPSPAEGPVIIGRGAFDFDGDGKPDELLLLFVTGQRGPDIAEWCGGFDKYTGQFDIVVILSSGLVTRASLNKLYGDELFFFAADLPFKIAFADYNGDGRPNFFIYQYANCFTYVYHFFTVGRSGEASALPTGPGGFEVILGGGVHEAPFHPTGAGFTYRDFDRDRSEWREGRCNWLRAAARFDCQEHWVKEGTRDQ
jgi:hypothetical protein